MVNPTQRSPGQELAEERLKDHSSAIDRAIQQQASRDRALQDMMAPRENKNIRQPVDGNPRQVEKEGRIRLGMGQEGEMNYLAEMYSKRHPGMQLMWIVDSDGTLDRWLYDWGAEPVPLENESRREIEGLSTKRSNSKYVCLVGGSIDGNTQLQYLLMIDPVLYDERKLKPVRERAKAIKESMYRGQATEGARDSNNELQTYAANLPESHVGDGTGYGERKDVVQQ